MKCFFVAVAKYGDLFGHNWFESIGFFWMGVDSLLSELTVVHFGLKLLNHRDTQSMLQFFVYQFRHWTCLVFLNLEVRAWRLWWRSELQYCRCKLGVFGRSKAIIKLADGTNLSTNLRNRQLPSLLRLFTFDFLLRRRLGLVVHFCHVDRLEDILLVDFLTPNLILVRWLDLASVRGAWPSYKLILPDNIRLSNNLIIRLILLLA